MKKSPDARRPEDSGSRITFVGILINIALLVVKLSVGLLTGSVGLIADGIHSGSDMATDLAVLGGLHLGARKADRNHPYGHGRYETLAGGIVAGALVFVGVFIAWEAGLGLYRGLHVFPGPVVMGIAALSIFTKEWLFRRTANVAREVGSPALHANAWHHRSDALSSVAVLAGGIGAAVGWGHADQLAGLLVGLMVVTAGGRTMVSVLHELSEGGLSRAEVEAIERALRAVPGVREWHQLRTRHVGREMFIDVHVLIAPDLTAMQAHRISMKVEEAIRTACARPANVIAHVEPDSDELADHHE